jgi:BlaI family penicillinase repressor
MPAEKRKPSANSRKPELPTISDAELVVMKVVWACGPVTANQVVGALENQTPWKPKTVQTLLRRLVHKGALAFDRRGREYLFKPLIDAGEFVHAASQSFLRRVFDGEVAPFLACFLEREKLTPDEIEELRRILDGKQT